VDLGGKMNIPKLEIETEKPMPRSRTNRREYNDTKEEIIRGDHSPVIVFAGTTPAIYGKPGEFEAIANHIKTKYRAKKVSIPFMWLARAAVKVVRRLA
jgi:hypothetical protein